MSEEAAVYITAPDKNETPVLPKRNGTRGLLPSTWLERTLRLLYVDAFGAAVETSGILLDLYPLGMVMDIKGAKTYLSWDVVRVVESVQD